MRKALFIDRDGTLIQEPADFQIDSLEKLDYYPGVFTWLGKIAREMDFELIMVTNQDGLGTTQYPKEQFDLVQSKLMPTLEQEGIVFSEILMDTSFPEDQSPNRKPRTGLMKGYMNGTYDLDRSFVIGDRITDMELALNMGCRGIWLNPGKEAWLNETENKLDQIKSAIGLQTTSWEDIYTYLNGEKRLVKEQRRTKETNIALELNLDGSGKADIDTGLSFFDHMLDQLARHGGLDIRLKVEGDLNVDEHHTIEDTALVLGAAIGKALGGKKGIERYGYCLPMDDCLALAALDFGGRPWLEWSAEFNREKVGDMPTEMFYHFFKSFSDAAQCNLHLKAEGDNEHHKIEALFKVWAKAIKMAVKEVDFTYAVPSTKGSL